MGNFFIPSSDNTSWLPYINLRRTRLFSGEYVKFLEKADAESSNSSETSLASDSAYEKLKHYESQFSDESTKFYVKVQFALEFAKLREQVLVSVRLKLIIFAMVTCIEGLGVDFPKKLPIRVMFPFYIKHGQRIIYVSLWKKLKILSKFVTAPCQSDLSFWLVS